MYTEWWILTNVSIHVTLLKPSYGTCPSHHQVPSCPFVINSIPLFSQPQDKTDRLLVTLVLLAVELYLNEIMDDRLFSLASLFYCNVFKIHPCHCMHQLFAVFIAEYYFTVWLYQKIFIHFPNDRYLSCFQFGYCE